MKLYLYILFSVHFFSLNAQQNSSFKLNIDKENYPILMKWEDVIFSSSNNANISLNNNKIKEISETKWQYIELNNLLKQDKEIKLAKFSLLHHNKNSEYIVAVSKNIISVLDKTATVIYTKEFPQQSVISSVAVEGNKLICSVSEFDKYCENSSWSLYDIDIINKKDTIILTNKDETLLYSIQQLSGKCPLLKKLSLSKDNKSILFNYTNAEYKKFCYNLFLYIKPGVFRIIKKSCNAYIEDTKFIDNNNFIIIEQPHADNNYFTMNYYNFKTEQGYKTKLYKTEDITGKYVNSELQNNILLVRFKREKYLYTSFFDLNGNFLKQEKILYHYMQSNKDDMYFTAFNNKVFNLNIKNSNNNYNMFSVYHEKDILDFCFIDSGKRVFTIDEIGTLKNYDYTISDEYLLTLENVDKSISIPVNCSLSKDKIDEINKQCTISKNKFVQKMINTENKRLSTEEAYIRTLSMNKIAQDIFEFDNKDYKTIDIIFDAEINRTFHNAKVFHISMLNNETYLAFYTAGNLNKFTYNMLANNQLLVVLSDKKIGYINNTSFKEKIIDAENKDVLEIMFKEYSNNDTEEILNQVLFLNK